MARASRQMRRIPTAPAPPKPAEKPKDEERPQHQFNSFDRMWSRMTMELIVLDERDLATSAHADKAIDEHVRFALRVTERFFAIRADRRMAGRKDR